MIKLTESAIKEVKNVMQEMKLDQNENVLRVSVVGGGCSGFSYSMSFEKIDEGDPLNDDLLNFEGIQSKVNRKCESYLSGTTIDFHAGIEKRGFVFDNPNAKKGCGCGNSFCN